MSNMEHELKIWPMYFCRVADGTKTFEYRKNDRGFQPGDTVRLREWDPSREVLTDENPVDGKVWGYGDYTGQSLRFKIGYVLPVEKGHVVFSLLPIAPQTTAVENERLREVIMDVRGYGRFDKDTPEEEINYIRRKLADALERGKCLK